MKRTKFLVKLNRVGIGRPQYLQHLGTGSVATTLDRKNALVMGQFAAEDAISVIRNARCAPELIPVDVPA